jgi:tetratricopeptide (TPR) repeat protein
MRKTPKYMAITPTAGFQRSLEQFRHLIFHLQMECGSIHDIFNFFQEENSMAQFDALKEMDPQLMPQLLAREYVLEARRETTVDKARRHLEKALQLDPNCPEACLELATLSVTPESAMMWYQKSMDATLKLLGPDLMHEMLEKFKKNPWRQVEIHTFIKAKASLAEKLFRNGYHETAIFHFEELLELNPGDDLNVRQFLMVSYLQENRPEDAAQLLQRFRGDWAASWFFCKALLQYKLDGDTRRSRRALGRAFRRNLWVPVYLLGLKKMPASKMPPQDKKWKVGSREEAVDCVKCIAPAFCDDTNVMMWMWEELKALV